MSSNSLPEQVQSLWKKYTPWKKAGLAALVLALIAALFSEILGRVIAAIVDLLIEHPVESIAFLWLAVLTICVSVQGQRLRDMPEQVTASTLPQISEAPEERILTINDLSDPECFLMRYAGYTDDLMNAKDIHDTVLEQLKFTYGKLPFGAFKHILEKLESKGFIYITTDRLRWKFKAEGRAFYYEHKTEIDERSRNKAAWEIYEI